MSAIIVAKGPTAKQIYKDDYPDTYIVGINQACKFIDKPDYVFMNDIESLKGLTSEDVKQVQCFVIPEFPHQNARATVSITKTDFITKLNKLNYTGKVVSFNLHTGPVKKDGVLTTIHACTTTSHTAIYYMSKVHGVTHFETYGFLIQNEYGYQNEEFYTYISETHSENDIKHIYKRDFNKNLASLNHVKELLNLQINRF